MKILLVALGFIFSIAPEILCAEASLDISSLVESLRSRKHNAGLTIAVFGSNDIRHLSHHGFADLSTHRELTNSSLFMIGSTTKAMTATAAGYLMQDGFLSWDERVKNHLPTFQLKDQKATEEATLRDLLLHRTGLPRHDFAWISRNWTSEQYLQLLPLLEPSAEFRSKWQYQNLMYMTAGLVVGAAAHKTWADVIEEKIFANLGMQNSRSLSAKVSSTDEAALPHAWNGRTLEKISPRDIDGVGPAGSVHSTILDMVKWIQFNMKHGDLGTTGSLSRKIMDEIHRPQIAIGTVLPFPEFSGESEYAFGWVTANYRGVQLLSHSGGIDGYQTVVMFAPKKDLGMVILTNGGDLPPDIVMLTVLDRLLGAEPVDWLQRLDSSAVEPPQDTHSYPQDLAVALGEFHHPAYGMLHVTQVQLGSATILNAKLNERFEFKLRPWLTEDPSIWKFEAEGFVFLFHLDSDGNVASIAANLEPSVPMIKFARR